MSKTPKKHALEDDSSTNLPEKSKHDLPDTLVINKLNKIQYAPGGSTEREEYQPKIPSVSCCIYDEDSDLIIVSFMNSDTKLFTLKGIDHKN